MTDDTASPPADASDASSSSSTVEALKDQWSNNRRELVAVIVLSITAVLTAWSGFESSKWGGEMSIAFSRASSTRIEAAREGGTANAARAFDLTMFAAYVDAVGNDNEPVADFVESRFTDHFAVAFDEWLAMEPLANPDAPPGPFALDSYVPPGALESADADARADALFQEALDNNARGDSYTLLTVLFALVLFFAAVSGRLESPRMSWLVLGMAVVLMCVGIGYLIAFPKII